MFYLICFEGYSLFWKARTILIKPGQCPCKLVKTESDLISPKRNNFEKKMDKKCIYTLTIDLYQKMKSLKNSGFFKIYQFTPKKYFGKHSCSRHTILNFSRFLDFYWKNYILENILAQDTLFDLMLCKVTSFTFQKMRALLILDIKNSFT